MNSTPSGIVLCLVLVFSAPSIGIHANEERFLTTETLLGDAVWAMSPLSENSRPDRRVVAKVWFEKQFLGDGNAYTRRAESFSEIGRRELRTKVVATLKQLSDTSYAAAESDLNRLLKKGAIRDLQRHWIVNGFTCTTTAANIEALKSVCGVKKIFVSNSRGGNRPPPRQANPIAPQSDLPSRTAFEADQYQRPWYISSLLADRVWKDFGVMGSGTLNIIHDHNFVYPENVAKTVYRNPEEIPENGIDDDRNGLIDDCYGFNFETGSPLLTTQPNAVATSALHGTMCAAIICGTGSEKSPYEFGIAPEGRWAGVVAITNVEAAVEWAIEHNADTYSMSFSRPNLGEMRSHWRKLMEHGSFCGVYFVSGAGNFAQSESVPKQMRTPEDIPNVVFAAAGVQRDLSRTPFSSKGPVDWRTEHYKDGIVQKPEVCAFNYGLPLLQQNGRVRPVAINGNSFAGPMFCGAIALMLSADPDLLPWDLKEIITSTATDIGPPGVDYETGHGLINCYRAVKEVLRRKALREGVDSSRFSGRSPNDEIDKVALRESLQSRKLVITRLQDNGPAEIAGIKPGDEIRRFNGMKIQTIDEWTKSIENHLKLPIKLEIERMEETLTFSLEPGSMGISRVTEAYDTPVFK